MNNSGRIEVVSATLAEKIEIPRFSEFGEKGFQRKLDNTRAKKMSHALANGSICPPILVGDLRGRYLLMDGQHRLEAWKISGRIFPLHAQVVKILDLNQAKKYFCEVNGTQKRVSARLRMLVDPGEFAYRCRELAKKFDLHPMDISSVLSGARGLYITIGQADVLDQITNDHWAMAERFLLCWSKDKRWAKGANVYRKPAVLRAMCHVAAKSKDVEGTLAELKRMDFSMQGKIARGYGGSDTCQKHMRDMIYEHIAKQVIG